MKYNYYPLTQIGGGYYTRKEGGTGLICRSPNSPKGGWRFNGGDLRG